MDKKTARWDPNSPFLVGAVVQSVLVLIYLIISNLVWTRGQLVLYLNYYTLKKNSNS